MQAPLQEYRSRSTGVGVQEQMNGWIVPAGDSAFIRLPRLLPRAHAEPAERVSEDRCYFFCCESSR